MGAANTKATAVSEADQTQPAVEGKSWLRGATPWDAVGTVEVAAADDDNSVYRFARVPSGARMTRLDLTSDAIAGATDYNLGLYKPSNIGGGTVVKTQADAAADNLFADALNLTSGNTVPVNVLYAQSGIENAEKRLWELLGYPADPFLEYDVALTGITVGTGAGTITLNVGWVL